MGVDAGPSTVTGADGRYSLELPAGTYARVRSGRARAWTRSSSARRRPGRRDAHARRVHAHGLAGERGRRDDRVRLTGGLPRAGRRPGEAIDQRPNTAWAGPGPETLGEEGPKQITVQLARPVNLSELTIDPTPDPRVPESWAIAEFRVETSTDGVTYARAGSGTFTSGDLGEPHPVALDAGTAAVRFVRLVVLSTQGPFSSNEGAMAVAEIAAYGTPCGAPTPTPTPGGGGGSTPAPPPVPSRHPRPCPRP